MGEPAEGVGPVLGSRNLVGHPQALERVPEEAGKRVLKVYIQAVAIAPHKGAEEGAHTL